MFAAIQLNSAITIHFYLRSVIGFYWDLKTKTVHSETKRD